MKMGSKGEAVIRNPTFTIFLIFVVGFLLGAYTLAFTTLETVPVSVVDTLKDNLYLITVGCVVIIAIFSVLYLYSTNRIKVR